MARWLHQCPVDVLHHKPAPGKWSKKEILGHLVDSAINNLRRFTEIQYQPLPYQVVKYNQDALVEANGYQDVPLHVILELWKALNIQIAWIMASQTTATLAYPVITPEGEHTDLRFLMEDYVDHMEHHLRQIGGKEFVD